MDNGQLSSVCVKRPQDTLVEYQIQKQTASTTWTGNDNNAIKYRLRGDKNYQAMVPYNTSSIRVIQSGNKILSQAAPSQ